MVENRAIARFSIAKMKFILGLKLGMSQIFDKKGNVIPVTLIEAGPCQVTQIKTKEPRKAPSEQRGKKDGYDAIQVGFKELKARKVKKSQKEKPFRYLREFKGDIVEYKVGDEIDVSIFQEGEKVKVLGVSKGKGFQGGVKRWGFSGRDATHGVKHEHRTLGSVGTSFPERVIKGRKMPGRMGGEQTTVKNLEIISIDKENNLLAVKGAVPGAKGILLEIKK